MANTNDISNAIAWAVAGMVREQAISHYKNEERANDVASNLILLTTLIWEVIPLNGGFYVQPQGGWVDPEELNNKWRLSICRRGLSEILKSEK